MEKIAISNSLKMSGFRGKFNQKKVTNWAMGHTPHQNAPDQAHIFRSRSDHAQ